jgi:YD repeat-containing protein
VVTGLTNVTGIAAGLDHSVAIDADGAVWCWGSNDSGQLGDGTTADSDTPVAVAGLTLDTVAIAAGMYHTASIDTDGAVWSWGYNGVGQLGDGTNTTPTTPVKAIGLTLDAIAVAAGSYHTVALDTGGAVWTWGYNGWGQLGDGTKTDSNTPAAVSGITDAVDIAAGYNHTVVLKSDGTVWGWGYNRYGQLGDDTTIDSTNPVQVIGLTDVVDITAGDDHTVAIKSDGTIWAWGYNRYGQLGDRTTGDHYTPVQVIGVCE